MWGISYWIFPVISGCAWLGMLIAMLVVWNVEGRPHYASMGERQSIAYISDVGAQGLKPLFIAASCVMVVFLDLSFISERWLRHRGRLARNRTVTEKVLTSLSLVCALVGTVGLICLTIFDTLRHPHLHDVFLILFMAGYLLSAIFICWEYQRLGINYREHRVLRASFWTKLSFIIAELALAIAFGVCNTNDHLDAGAILEWTIAFLFTFYVLSFFIDLIPAVRTKGVSSHETAIQMESDDPLARQHEGQDNGTNYYGDGSRHGRRLNNHSSNQNGMSETGYAQTDFAQNGHQLSGNAAPYTNGVNGAQPNPQPPLSSNF